MGGTATKIAINGLLNKELYRLAANKQPQNSLEKVPLVYKRQLRFYQSITDKSQENKSPQDALDKKKIKRDLIAMKQELENLKKTHTESSESHNTFRK